MPAFSERSNNKLTGCDYRLVKVFRKVIKRTDCTIICGHRNRSDQDEAFRTGHSKAQWGESPHNSYPSRAVDVLPYNNGIDWNDRDGQHFFAGAVLATARSLEIELTWGGHFKSFYDGAHFELTDWKD